MTNAERDENNVPVAMGVSSVDWETPIPIEVNPTTWAIMAEI